ncbi:MAG: glycerophosphodiester phosphodiesterase family protein [Blautia sp.]|jgi:glycerophosphoryl diester phosphodiesterase
MRDLFRHFSYVLRKNWLTLLIFEIAYRAATYMLTLQVVRQAVKLSLQVSGYSNLTAENFISFLKQPFTLVLLALVALFLLFIITVEIASLMVCFQYSSENRRIYINDMFFVGIRQTFHLMRRKPVAWILCMAAALPFLELQFLAWEVSYVKILQYAARVIYQWIPHGVALGAAGILLLYLSYHIAFSLPYLLLEEKNALVSIRLGVALQKRDRTRNFLGGIFVQLGVLVISLLFYVLAMSAAVGFAMRSETKGGIVSSLLVYSNWVDMGIGLAAGALNTVLGVAFFFAVYRLRRKRMLAGKLELAQREIRLPMLRRLGRRRIIAVVMLLVFLAEMGYVVYLAENSRQISDDILVGMQITAHRGGAKYAPENTLSALAYAKEQMADYAEIDVQETKDGVLVLLHDNNLKRTTGKKKNIWSANYSEVMKLDAGSSFSKKFAGEKVPTLREAVRFCGDSLNLIIEIKYNGHNADIVEKVVKVVEDYNLEGRVIICSMHYGFLQEIKEMNPDITTSYVMSVAYGDMEDLEDADCLSVKYSYLNSLFVEKAHKEGKMVHAWTINTQWLMERMQRCQVDNVITDTPAAARQVISGEWVESIDFWELLKYVL